MEAPCKWLGIGTIVISCSVAIAVPPSAGKGYEKIPERNLFGLKEIQSVQPTNNTPVQLALPKVFLTGITTLGGFKRAFLSVQFPAKPGQPAKEESMMLTEGQRDDDIEVISIDENAKEVRVNNWGTVMALNFDQNGIKTAANATGPGPNQPNPTGPSSPGPVSPMPQANPSTAPITPPATGYRRTLRLPNPVPAPPVPTVPVTPPPSSAAFGGPAAAAQQQAAGASTPISAEEELLLRALQEKNGGQVAPQ
jgi:hypothetical protein